MWITLPECKFLTYPESVVLKASLTLSKRISSAYLNSPPVPFGEAALREARVLAAALN
jgi:hypothetical protein